MNRYLKSVLILSALLLPAFSGRAQDQELAENEILRRDHTLKFKTREEAFAWKFSDLSFEDWSEAVQYEGITKLIHREKTEDFYYAILRYQGHLIFCINDLSEKPGHSSSGVEASDPKIAWRVRKKGGSKIMGFDYRIEHPGGSIGHSEIFAATEIEPEFEGALSVTHKVKDGDGKEREVKAFEVDWKKSDAE